MTTARSSFLYPQETVSTVLETSIAIISGIGLIVIAAGLFISIINQYGNKSFFVYMSAGASFLFAAGLSLLSVLGVISGIWLMPAIIAVALLVALGSVLVTLATEERAYNKAEEALRPITPTEVEKGLDWQKVEKWLKKNKIG